MTMLPIHFWFPMVQLGIRLSTADTIDYRPLVQSSVLLTVYMGWLHGLFQLRPNLNSLFRLWPIMFRQRTTARCGIRSVR